MRTSRRPSSLAVLVVILTTIFRIPVSTQDAAAAERIAKVKASFAALGIGPGADVTVELRTGKEVKGVLVGPLSDEALVVARKGTGELTSIPFQDIASLERGESGASRAKPVILGLISLAAGLIIVGVIHSAVFKAPGQ